ncbi:MAG: cupin domain-containing protein [Acidobacteriaceae bacterium]|nr:cupin domain-containing protein [Acidobacteriaceae bacterium]
MIYSRRDLSLLLPTLAAAARASAAENDTLAGKCYPFESMPVKTNPTNHSESRQVFDGKSHSGCHLDMHITTLPPGQMPHPPHTHEHDELITIQKGTLEATIAGQTTRVGPGSVVYVDGTKLHGWKNVGDTPAQYFVLAIGRSGNA